MKSEHNIRLTSSEIAVLWTTYINDTMAECVLRYFLNKVEDSKVQSVIEFALGISQEHIKELTKLFNLENFPVPQGFTENDVNVNAKRLFSDSFFIYYLKNMSKVGMITFSMAYSMST